MRDARGQRLLEEASGEPDPNVIICCSRCRRPLRTAKHRSSGVGPVCKKKPPH